jgi:hypothetical protein
MTGRDSLRSLLALGSSRRSRTGCSRAKRNTTGRARLKCLSASGVVFHGCSQGATNPRNSAGASNIMMCPTPGCTPRSLPGEVGTQARASPRAALTGKQVHGNAGIEHGIDVFKIRGLGSRLNH